MKWIAKSELIRRWGLSYYWSTWYANFRPYDWTLTLHDYPPQHWLVQFTHCAFSGVSFRVYNANPCFVICTSWRWALCRYLLYNCDRNSKRIPYIALALRTYYDMVTIPVGKTAFTLPCYFFYRTHLFSQWLRRLIKRENRHPHYSPHIHFHHTCCESRVKGWFTYQWEVHTYGVPCRRCTLLRCA